MGLFSSGCNQKIDQKAQTNITQLQIPLQTTTSQTITSHPIDSTQIVQGTVGGTTNIEIPVPNNIKNINYPDVVADVGDTKITGLQLTWEVTIKQNAYVNMKKPQDESYYEKVALGLLVKNALIDNEVEKQGKTVTAEEAKSYLEQQEKSLDSLQDSDPTKINYNNAIKVNGFSNASDYINSPRIISTYQKLLGRGKLESSILQSIPQGQNEATEAWDDYTDKLINQGNYKIYLPVDIQGYRQLEEQVVLGK